MAREPTLNYLNNLNSWNSSSIFLWSGIWSISVTVLCTWKRDVISAADCSVFIRSFGAFISCPVQIYVFPIFMSLFILHRENSFKFSTSVTARSSFSRLCPARMWLAAHLFRTVTSSWSIDPFNIMKRPNFQWPVVWAFALCNVGAAQWDLLWLTFAMGQLFPCLSAFGVYQSSCLNFRWRCEHHLGFLSPVSQSSSLPCLQRRIYVHIHNGRHSVSISHLTTYFQFDSVL